MRSQHQDAMRRKLDEWEGDACLLDVGAFNVNGSFRSLVDARGWGYVGVDIVPGPGVDVVSDDPYRYPFEDGDFDIVISGSVMEHVEAIWRWVPELARLVRPGGMLAIITHTHWDYHPHPVDCWRIMPDGMRYLFDETDALERYDIRMMNAHDIMGAAWRVA